MLLSMSQMIRIAFDILVHCNIVTFIRQNKTNKEFIKKTNEGEGLVDGHKAVL